MDQPGTIPYEKQTDLDATRSCGAACLSMVYRSLGTEVPQTEIWPLISKPNRFGVVSSLTHLMCKDALNRGFSAVAFQARHPLQVLTICRNRGLRAILNHRLRAEAPTGHYSLLVDVEEGNIVLHDPLLGPSRSTDARLLLELWLPRFAESEIVGNVVIAIAPFSADPAPPCEFCHTPIPATVACPSCHQAVPLAPGAALGCVNEGCIARMWNFICCPSCDFVWTFDSEGKAAAGSTSILPRKPGNNPLENPTGALNVDKLFAQLDKFTAHITAIPGAANHADVKAQLDIIAMGKEKFKLGYAGYLARSIAVRDQLAAVGKAHQEKQEAQLKIVEEMNTPPPPLDGNALGAALLKNLGFK